MKMLELDDVSDLTRDNRILLFWLSSTRSEELEAVIICTFQASAILVANSVKPTPIAPACSPKSRFIIVIDI